MSTKTILLAEASQDVINMTKIALETSGYHVLVAHTGLEALKIMEDEIPDLLITGLVMPEMNGFELIVEMEKRKIKVKTLVLAFQKSDEEIIRRPGLNSLTFLYRPFTPQTLVSYVNGILTRSMAG